MTVHCIAMEECHIRVQILVKWHVFAYFPGKKFQSKYGLIRCIITQHVLHAQFEMCVHCKLNYIFWAEVTSQSNCGHASLEKTYCLIIMYSVI